MGKINWTMVITAAVVFFVMTKTPVKGIFDKLPTIGSK